MPGNRHFETVKDTMSRSEFRITRIIKSQIKNTFLETADAALEPEAESEPEPENEPEPTPERKKPAF